MIAKWSLYVEGTETAITVLICKCNELKDAIMLNSVRKCEA